MNKFYVYGFYDNTLSAWIYIGKGTGSRIYDNKRSYHLMRMLENHSVTRTILIDNITEEQAFFLEKSAKEMLINFGNPIIDYENVSCTLNQRRGIEEAKKLGKFKGRKSITIKPELFNGLYESYKDGKLTKVDFSKRLGVSRPTLDKLLREKPYEN